MVPALPAISVEWPAGYPRGAQRRVGNRCAGGDEVGSPGGSLVHGGGVACDERRRGGQGGVTAGSSGAPAVMREAHNKK